MNCSKFENESGSDTTTNTIIQGPASSPKCKVLNGSSKFWLLVDLPVFYWGAGPHKFAATPVVLRRLRTQIIYKQSFSN
jgi:hypothetical protein